MGWLTEAEVLALQVGDEVGVSAGTHYSAPTIERVTRRTPTQVIIGNMRFNKRGRLISSSVWNGRFLHDVESAREQIAEFMASHGHALACNAMRKVDWRSLSLAQLEQVQTLLATFTTSPDAAASSMTSDALSTEKHEANGQSPV